MKLRSYQQKAVAGVFDAWKSASSTLVVMPTGCHAKGEKVLGSDGTARRVEEVRVGDLLLGPGGQERRVLCLHRGVDELYRVVPVKGVPFIVNGDHTLTLVRTNEKGARNRGGELVDVTVREWLTWSRWRKHIYKLFRSHADFDPKHLDPWYKRVHVSPYLLGTLLGDGSFRQNMGFTNADWPIIHHLEPLLAQHRLRLAPARMCGAAIGYNIRPAVKGRHFVKDFRKWLKLFGLDMTDSGSKLIPHTYKIAPRQDRLDLLAGLMDTDGNNNGSSGFDYVSKSVRLANDVAFIARSLGLAAYVSPCSKFCQTGGGGIYFRVSISGATDQVPCRLARKQTPPRRQKKNVLRTGFSVEPVGVGDYFGFTVDGDNRYLLDDFTVTHNCGKTVVLAHVIDQRPPGRAMLLAHREELIWQGANKIEAVTGVRPDIEMAEFRAADSLLHKADVVVSSIQTQNAGSNEARMTKFDPMQFSLLIVDEAHHATAASYRRVIEHYRKNPNLKVLGVTATPDRSDEEALGQIFETVAFDYELLDAINDGWLVPIAQRAVHVEGLDLSTVKTTAGDLNGADLARVMEYEESLHGIASPTMDLIGQRKTLLFAASVAHAERLCEIFNRHRANMARFVCGKTPKDDRRAMLADYAVGKFQVLCNVGVATEGFDDPGIAVIVMARPTKSRSLYAQMAGRGTRPLPGIVDGFEEDSQGRLGYSAAELRRAAIAASAKPTVEVIDFVGNCGRHKLMTTADILGGNYSDAVVERARAKAASAGAPVDMVQALADAEQEIKEEREEAARAARMAVRVKAKYSTSLVNPFELLNIEPWQERGWNKGREPSEKQLACLEKFGVNRDQVKTATQANQLITELIERRSQDKCTLKQARILARNGYQTDVTFAQARELIDQIAKEQGWGQKRPAPAATGTSTASLSNVRVY